MVQITRENVRELVNNNQITLDKISSCSTEELDFLWEELMGDPWEDFFEE